MLWGGTQYSVKMVLGFGDLVLLLQLFRNREAHGCACGGEGDFCCFWPCGSKTENYRSVDGGASGDFPSCSLCLLTFLISLGTTEKCFVVFVTTLGCC